jgi:benzoyl-CoA reductase/2-hydroxyglutaryl-CoA dehydratase subunit BcrC/BadD/HgdB
MIELLKLCGYDSQTIDSDLSRIEKAFQILGIEEQDIDRGKERLRTYYNMDLESVRRAIGLCIKNAVNTVLAREDGRKKIIFSFMAPGMEIIGTALRSKSEDIFVANLNGPLQFLLGSMFDKMVPVLEASEKRWLKAGKAYHCANVKASLGFLSLKLIPEPDLLITSGHLCDTAPKSTDLIQELFGIPVCTYDACVDQEFSEYPDFKRMVGFSSKSARYLAKRIGEVVGFEISDSMMMESIEARSGISDNVREMKSIMESGDPMPISATHDIVWNCVATLSYSISNLNEPAEVMETAVSEVKAKVEIGEGILEKGAPRILALCPPHYSDPRWEHLPYEYGMALISSETGFFPPYGERTPKIEEDFRNDPYALMLMGVQSSLNQSLKARTTTIIEVCKRLQVDGVLNKYHVGCRIGVADALIVKEAIAHQLGIPVLTLEWEGFDPRVMNEEQFSRQLETFRALLDR